jgi:pterin-4a-carbinolamine dehydratase
MAKEMEGDNEKRRALARAAREQGRSASEAGVSLGASKQIEHAEHAKRSGPPPAGTHKPGPQAPIPDQRPASEPARPTHAPPVGDTAPDPGALRLRYRELVEEAGAWAGVEFDQAKGAARATVTVLARALSTGDRDRLIEALPAELFEGQDVTAPYDGEGSAGFVREVAALAQRPPEQARLQAQAVLGAIAAQDARLLPSLDLPSGLDELTRPPEPGGGVVGPQGHAAPLEEDEVRAALRRLPEWTGDTSALTRTLILPPDQLDRVLRRLDRLKQQLGRGPRISRPDERTALLMVRTTHADAVTALDVELAERIDDAISEAGAGLA